MSHDKEKVLLPIDDHNVVRSKGQMHEQTMFPQHATADEPPVRIGALEIANNTNNGRR
jgi:hypothetical protein